MQLVTLIVLQPISVTKKLEVPITLERHWNDAIACNTIQVALVLQRLSSNCGVGDNNHRGHPPMAPNKITNCIQPRWLLPISDRHQLRCLLEPVLVRYIRVDRWLMFKVSQEWHKI
jgi:hypothetical protein